MHLYGTRLRRHVSDVDIWFRVPLAATTWPRYLVDVNDRDLSTTVLGHKISMPIMVARMKSPTNACSFCSGGMAVTEWMPWAMYWHVRLGPLL